MRHAAVVIVILGLLVALMVFGPGYLEQDTLNQTSGSPDWIELPECRPLVESCRWGSGEDQGEITLERIGDSPSGPELRLTLNYPGAVTSPLLILKGESMYMGEYPLRLQRLAGGQRFRVTFTPPFCSTDPHMTWRAELSDDGDRLAIPFRILFQGHGQS
ncbi:hypothetical protein [uncultured Marinobacter sp.]|uniref:hypothetical protein n=1 Tax=uncultured Marinobacter sp. TaxID=187379 RepID=UPI0030DAAF75